MSKSRTLSLHRVLSAITVIVLWFIAIVITRFTIDVFVNYDSAAPKEQGNPIIIGLFTAGLSIALITASILATRALARAKKRNF